MIVSCMLHSLLQYFYSGVERQRINATGSDEEANGKCRLSGTCELQSERFCLKFTFVDFQESYSDVIKTLDREMEEAKQRKQFYSCLRSGDDDDNDGETEAEEEMKADKETTSGETEKINMQEEKTKHKQIIVPTATTGTQTTTSQQTDNNNKS